MKVGDLVGPKTGFHTYVPGPDNVSSGVVIGFDHGDPIVYWNEKFCEEIEYAHQLEVLNV
tara:strand:+ start:265 stop:444 length:180 start_codon:yes stop_codon:yes gene_type:complete